MTNVRIFHSDDSSRIGNLIWHADSVASTNATLRELVEDGWAGHGAVVWADEQTAGRGRLGRAWASPAGGGLFVSVFLAGANNSLLYCLTSLAVRDAIADVCPLSPAIKWPNDVLINGLKTAGILVEALPHGAVIGVGINTNPREADLARIRDDATSLQVQSGDHVDHSQLLYRLLTRLEERYIRSNRSADLLFHEWKVSLVTLGQSVEVHTTRETMVGVAVDVAMDGSLLILNDKRLVRVYAGDVRIRPR